jgi:hypothetical protein
MLNELEAEYGGDTMLAVYRLPIIRAAIALSMGHPERALDLLEPVRPYDLALADAQFRVASFGASRAGEKLLGIGRSCQIEGCLPSPGCDLEGG